MKQEHFDELMNDARDTFRRPPEADYEAMWRAIELNAERGTLNASHQPSAISRRSAFSVQRIALIAATLIIGVVLGRASMSMGRSHPAVMSGSNATQVANARPDSTTAAPFDAETSRYLGQTAALLIALPAEVKAGTDEQFMTRASDLLSRTRLLMDSPAASDPQMRNLLDDLELVLAQVVRLQNDKSSRLDLDLIRRTVEQHNVIPRLRTAAADISAD